MKIVMSIFSENSNVLIIRVNTYSLVFYILPSISIFKMSSCNFVQIIYDAN